MTSAPPSAGDAARSLRALVGGLLAGLLVTPGLVVAGAAPAGAADAQTTLTAVADTYVDSGKSTKAYGSSTQMTVDASPHRLAYLRFDLSGLAGQTITAARLRLHSQDSAPTGGRLHSISATTWTESITYRTKPALDGAQVAAFGAVSNGAWYEVDVPVAGLTTGLVSFALDTPSGNGARWSTRESANKPSLVVTTAIEEAAPPPPEPEPEPEPPTTEPEPPTEPQPDPAPVPAPTSDWRQVADAGFGSSEPTYYAANSRTVVTVGGRQLALHGRHKSGVQLTWRDPDGDWQTGSTGDSTTGTLLGGTYSGDWPASLAVAEVNGVEHAWVVWSGPSAGYLRPVQLRRLSNLDAAAGPHLGPIVTIDAAPRGAYKADLAFEVAADGSVRGCVLYTRRAGDTAYELVASWFTDLTTDTPELSSSVITTTNSGAHYGSLVSTPAGLRAIARSAPGSGTLKLFGHDRNAPLSTWFSGATGPAIPNGSSPAGAVLPTGEVVVALESNLTDHVSSVYRFSADGLTVSLLHQQADLAQPSVVASGDGLWLVGIRSSDGALVSRSRSGGVWDGSDRVEVAAETAGRLAWPSALRQADGQLRVLVEGAGISTSTSSVWSWTRSL